MKIYTGRRHPKKVVRVSVDGGPERPLRHYVLHSPTGLEWGYGGSGPADLALSILADVLNEQPTRQQLYRGEARCVHLHQALKWALVCHLPSQREWVVSEDSILAWLDNGARSEDPVAFDVVATEEVCA